MTRQTFDEPVKVHRSRLKADVALIRRSLKGVGFGIEEKSLPMVVTVVVHRVTCGLLAVGLDEERARWKVLGQGYRPEDLAYVEYLLLRPGELRVGEHALARADALLRQYDKSKRPKRKAGEAAEPCDRCDLCAEPSCSMIGEEGNWLAYFCEAHGRAYTKANEKRRGSILASIGRPGFYHLFTGERLAPKAKP